MLKKIKHFAQIFLSISGYRPEHASLPRTIAMAASIGFTLYLSSRRKKNLNHALSYYAVSTAGYVGFILFTLPQNGFRTTLIERFGEKNGFRIYEAILAFLFFHNGSSIGYVSAASANTLGRTGQSRIIAPAAIGLLIAGFVTKIWAARVVGIDIYYWKDMFLGRKITDFVVSGPYKLLSNPMYGAGQLQSYGFALLHRSAPGLIISAINQCAVFSFYFLAERKFIEQTYLDTPSNSTI
ncbi:MAG TPA: methyltransferase [Patescibacteria group bacterium]|nr:methyltransferase [Patescibacteria group bacterium]